MSQKPTIVVSTDLAKSHVDSFTRKDGTFVQAHDDKRQAAAPKAPALGTHAKALRESSKPGDLDHWHNQVAADHMADGDHKALGATLRSMDTAARDHVLEHIHPDHHKGLGFETINHARSVDGYHKKFPAAKPAAESKTSPKAALSHNDWEQTVKARHSNVSFKKDAKSGKVHAFSGAESVGHYQFAQGGNPASHHVAPFKSKAAGGSAEENKAAEDMKARNAAAPAARKAKMARDSKLAADHERGYSDPHGYVAALSKPADKKSEPAAGGYSAPKKGDVGHEEHTQYGAYFRKGDKVKDQAGVGHEVLSHSGPQVTTTGGGSYHPTKLKFVSGGLQKSMLVVHPDLLK